VRSDANLTSQRQPTINRIVPALALLAIPALAGVEGVWEPEGPMPNTGGQVENVVPNDEVVGAIHTVAAHPSDADRLFVGAGNGGVWSTSDATSVSPTWTPLTDDLGSLSIGALEFDPTDGSSQTVVAGIGRFSSFLRRGGDRIGLLRTIDGGASWSLLDGGGTLTGKNCSGIAGRGTTIVAAFNDSDSGLIADRGIFRSTDTGTTFTQISDGDGSSTGLPLGTAFDLVGDPSSDAVLYVAVKDATASGGLNGIYKSSDTGTTWSLVSDLAMNALISNATSNVEMAVGSSNNVYAVIANGGVTVGVFRSGNGAVSWTQMDTPSTHPGGQASIHLSVVADPADANIVYIGGDRQNIGDFGATDFSGRLFRGDAAAGGGSQFVPLTHTGTASASAPHADSREMAIDAAGNLIESDDGGIYKRTSPQDTTGDWFSIIGNLSSNEMHSMSYDGNGDVVFGGAQDTGTPAQTAPDAGQWFSVSTADGGDTAVDILAQPGFSARYSSFQVLSSFRRQVYDADNIFQSQTFPSRTLVGGGTPFTPSFVTPLQANRFGGDRLLLAGTSSLYESLDSGTTIREVGPGISVNGFGSDTMAYGASDNVDVIYAGDDDDLFVRTDPPPGGSFSQLSNYPGDTINSVELNFTNSSEVFVVDAAGVYHSDDTGVSWTEITGDLRSLDPGLLRAVAYLEAGPLEVVVIGGNRGVFAATSETGFTDWEPLGGGFPDAVVYELFYDWNRDKLLAGVFGRGAWSLSPALGSLGLVFVDGFESGDTDRWSNTVPGFDSSR